VNKNSPFKNQTVSDNLIQTYSPTGGTPIDFEYLYYRGDAFRYQLRIERGERS